MSPTYSTYTNNVIELSFHTGKVYQDPFNEIELDATFTSLDGKTLRVPAFWAGDGAWKVRFSTPNPGMYYYQLESSDKSDHAASDQKGSLEVLPYTGEHKLYSHGGLRVRQDRKGMEHLDGTPFFWLGDTWWLVFCGRIKYPEEFKRLISDRTAKGFSLIHMVAGLFPDMPAYDPRGANGGGYSWEENFSRINPAFYDEADLKLQAVVESGMVPLIVGSWGYYLSYMGVEKMKKHWRYVVARWGAYPIVWCLAGEVTMPFYLSETKDQDAENQKKGWSQVGHYLKQIDPFNRPITAHSGATGESPTELSDASFLDFNFIQTGHGNQSVSLGSAVHFMRVMENTTLKPVVNAESNYEGILGAAWEDVQRFIFWTTMLSGGTGFSYGANGIWQVNQEGKPFGPSPHGMSWGDIAWSEAMHFKGSTQIALGKKLLERYPYWEFEPHPEWISVHATQENSYEPYAAGVPGIVRVFYFPYPLAPWIPNLPDVLDLEKDTSYDAFFFNPVNGKEQQLGLVKPTDTGVWRIPMPSWGQDIVLVLEKK